MTKREKRLRPSSYFLGCFGFSRKIYSDKAKEDGGEKRKKKKRSRWFLRLKNGGEIKPSVIKEIEKPILKVEDETDKQKNLPVISCFTDRKNIPVDDKSMIMETKETKPKELRDISPNRSKTMEPNGSFKKYTYPERISNSTHYGQPELKPIRAKDGSQVDKFGPIIGIMIIILTLMIMLVWGRVCAILCTSAWCYLLPALKNAAKRKRKSNGFAYVSDLNSESYKRKVVLDGFLGRQNRVSLS